MFHSGFNSRLSIAKQILLASIFIGNISKAQSYEIRSVLYNTLLGGFSGGIGAMINMHKGEKALKAFTRGFVTGCSGGAVVYAGKKMNRLIATQKNISYAWLSRAVFSAGNSVVENAAGNRLWYGQWHYDIGFVRFELHTIGPPTLQPKLMPSYLGAFAFTVLHGRLDWMTSLRSGTFIFTNVSIGYAPYLVGSTTGNSVLFVDSLNNYSGFHAIFAHEMVHTCQFQELSGLNNYFNPLTTRWRERFPVFRKLSKYIYGDLNYEFMLINYFIIQGSIFPGQYCHNFLENEAEVLSTGRLSCPKYH